MYLVEYFFYNYRNLLCHKRETKNKQIDTVEYSTREQQKLENFSSILTSVRSQEIAITTNIRDQLTIKVLHRARKSTSYLSWPLCKYFSNKTKATAFLLIFFLIHTWASGEGFRSYFPRQWCSLRTNMFSTQVLPRVDLQTACLFPFIFALESLHICSL